jgi:hypothetical protein
MLPDNQGRRIDADQYDCGRIPGCFSDFSDEGFRGPIIAIGCREDNEGARHVGGGKLIIATVGNRIRNAPSWAWAGTERPTDVVRTGVVLHIRC